MNKPNIKRVLICGDRNWKNRELIKQYIYSLPEGSVLIHGACRGADEISGEYGKERGFSILAFPAEWNKYGKPAGPIRNKQMIVEGKPNTVVAFHNNIKESRGTANMLKQAEKYNIPYTIISEPQEPQELKERLLELLKQTKISPELKEVITEYMKQIYIPAPDLFLQEVKRPLLIISDHVQEEFTNVFQKWLKFEEKENENNDD